MNVEDSARDITKLRDVAKAALAHERTYGCGEGTCGAYAEIMEDFRTLATPKMVLLLIHATVGHWFGLEEKED